MDTVDKVRKTIKEYNMIEPGDRVLCALSGGSDSVAMFHILMQLSEELEFKLFAAHVNHNIRAEAKQDELFVKKLCDDNNIVCFIKNADIPAYAAKHKISSELAGRNIRYAFFDEICKSKNINKTATAHNKNDSAESVLLHLIRGCGIDGMCGISPKRDGHIIRPIIDLTKREIEEYCHNNSFDFVVDKTNFEANYTRNKIRLHLLPIIENELNSNFIKTVTDNSVLFSESADFINDYTKKAFDRLVVSGNADIDGLLAEHTVIAKGVIRLMYFGFRNKNEKLSSKHINDILDLMKCGMNRRINLPNGISAVTEYGKLKFVLTGNNTDGFCYSLKIGEEKYIPETNEYILIKKETLRKKNTADKIYFYADENKTFSVRNKRNGDFFYPFGMTGKKKLSDLFTDIKLARDKRDKVPIITCNDDIVWIAGTRCDRRFSENGVLLSCEIRKRT